MPQWSSDRALVNARYPDERLRALCPRAHAPLLLRYDHHVVWISGRPALLRTYHWAEQEPDAWPSELSLEVSLTYAPGHPPAGAEVQQIVDTLAFSAVDASTRTEGTDNG